MWGEDKATIELNWNSLSVLIKEIIILEFKDRVMCVRISLADKHYDYYLFAKKMGKTNQNHPALSEAHTASAPFFI